MSRLMDYFFAPVSAKGWGLMRIAWAGVTLFFILLQAPDVARYYSGAGLIPVGLEPLIMRSVWRFSLLDYVTSPSGVSLIYILLLLALTAALIGYRTRLATVASLLLVLSFYERNRFLVTGGELVLRSLGFLLAISPVIDCYSLDRRIKPKWRRPDTMPIWPYRLLVWHLVIMYAMSVWYQSLGTTWRAGTAIALTFQHPFVGRFTNPGWLSLIAATSASMGFAITIWKLAWLLLLVPGIFGSRLFKGLLIIGGLLFHGSSLFLMYLGSFSVAALAAYAGLLSDADINTFASRLKRGKERLTQGLAYLRAQTRFPG